MNVQDRDEIDRELPLRLSLVRVAQQCGTHQGSEAWKNIGMLLGMLALKEIHSTYVLGQKDRTST